MGVFLIRNIEISLRLCAGSEVVPTSMLWSTQLPAPHPPGRCMLAKADVVNQTRTRGLLNNFLLLYKGKIQQYRKLCRHPSLHYTSWKDKGLMMPLIPFTLVLLLNARILHVNLHHVRGGHRDSWTVVQQVAHLTPHSLTSGKTILKCWILLVESWNIGSETTAFFVGYAAKTLAAAIKRRQMWGGMRSVQNIRPRSRSSAGSSRLATRHGVCATCMGLGVCILYLTATWWSLQNIVLLWI